MIRFPASCRNSGDEEEQGEGKKKANPLDGIIGCFLFAWMIAGNMHTLTYSSIEWG
jgi:hypothetical protein